MVCLDRSTRTGRCNRCNWPARTGWCNRCNRSYRRDWSNWRNWPAGACRDDGDK